MWSADQVAAAQNATPTDFSALDAQLADKSLYNTNRFAGDASLHVRFYSRAVIDVEKSQAANRPIFIDAEFVEIMTPGDKWSIINRQVGLQEHEDQRFPRQYAAFKEGREQTIGTPLIALLLSDSQIAELAYFKIRTVEHLSNMPDNLAGQFMGFVDLKNKAKAYLINAQGPDAIRAELKAEFEAKLDKMQSLYEERLAALENPKPKAARRR